MERLPFQYEKNAYWQFLCPACKKERRSVYWPSPRARHYGQLAVFVLFLAMVLWQWVGIKGVFLGFPVWAVFELAYRARSRQSLICPYCAFDPYLFKVDPKKARAKMDEHFAGRRKKIEERQKKLEERFGPLA